MRKNFLFAAIAIVTMVACSQQPNVEPDPLDDGTQVAVEFGASAPSSISVKSAGAVESAWSGETLYIYGVATDVTDLSTGDIFIANEAASAPTSGSQGAIELLNSATGEPYYYSASKTYNFYGYYADDATTGEPVLGTSTISVPFEINGGQDLMIAYTDKAADAALATSTVSEDRLYSAYAARRGVQPNLIFSHKLAKFTFEIVAGSEAGANVNIDAIGMESVSTGNLELVSGELTDLGTAVDTLYLQEESATGALTTLTPVKANAYQADRANTLAVGSSLMLVPGQASYKLFVQTSLDDSVTAIEPQEWDVNIANITGGDGTAPTDAFAAGYSYKITIVIYGVEEVTFTVELEDWKDGGSTTIDPDLI